MALKKIIPDIIFQHAEDASFLWGQRNLAVKAPHYTLEDLQSLDEKLEANLDGLLVAGDYAWQLCKQNCNSEEPEDIFPAAVLAFASGLSEHIGFIFECYKKTPELEPALVSAIAWLPFAPLQQRHNDWLHGGSIIHQYMALCAYSLNGIEPGEILDQLLVSDVAKLRARALRTVGELALTEKLPLLLVQLNAEDERCRFWSAWSAVLLGERNVAQKALENLIETNGSTFLSKALDIYLRTLPMDSALAYLSRLKKRSDKDDRHMRRLIISGYGTIGNVNAISWLLSGMDSPEWARAAGAAFTTITGADLEFLDLDGDEPAGAGSGPNDNPEDPNVDLDIDDDLPWPNPSLVAGWWGEQKQAYHPNQSYLCGCIKSEKTYQKVLATGYQNQRLAASIERALGQPEARLINVKAPAYTQKRKRLSNL